MKFPPGYVPGVGTPKPVTSSFGERLLASMGWEKGQGLGKNQHGIKEAIAVKNKQDTKGVCGGVEYGGVVGKPVGTTQPGMHAPRWAPTQRLGTGRSAIGRMRTRVQQSTSRC